MAGSMDPVLDYLSILLRHMHRGVHAKLVSENALELELVIYGRFHWREALDIRESLEKHGAKVLYPRNPPVKPFILIKIPKVIM